MIKNPVLTGFHPDPSPLYHEGWFYIATSTFEWYPGVKLSRSRDLANWETVGYPLSRENLLYMEGNPKSTGIWAPCLTYSDGLFYLTYTDVKLWTGAAFKDTPNYITTATRLEGPWSDPVYVNCSGFDPSLFHAADGRKYFLNMEWDYRARGKEQFSGILLTELDPKTLRPISEPVKIWRGSEKGSVEGPHLCQKDGYYYLFTAEGGTEYEHAETVARARDILGPYELHPNTFLSCAEHAPESPLQKTGHGGIVCAEDGRWWYACLCGRPILSQSGERRCPLGRETLINEVIWSDGWPYLKNGTLVPDEMFEGYGEKKPDEPKRYDFSRGEPADFALDFQSLRSAPKYAFIDGCLRLFGGNSPACAFGQSVFARRQQHFAFEAATCLTLHGRSFQKMAGLLYRYDDATYYFLRVAYDEARGQNCLGLLCSVQGRFSMPLGSEEIPVGAGPIHLRVRADHGNGVFSYALDGVKFTDIDYPLDVTLLSDECATPLGFTGAFIGMQAVDLNDKTAWADFSYFQYTPLS